ncbi:hypothetical protein PCC6912_39520 [Chlorogloeopsis fritschii PCC 6912]|uniref:Uncharacterized protein n=1 Tax=Chlorogloeopsis fritschii PCC 6912 TaxID=211165 RepID=A0A3S0Y5G1_CHLFR|nr:hypothetical protein [Chlorogloeopsis fritschii]RUR76993.1 hypothetical protein PCC6912_39520 [Chlorogloeopsis fritschii PCC 6912]
MTTGIALSSNFASLSPKQWNDYLSRVNTQQDRQNQLNSLIESNTKGGSSNSSFSGSGGAMGGAPGGSFGASSSSLFGGVGGLSGFTDMAKDLARFRLGLDQEQARFSRGLREEEAQADFGRNFKLADQQIVGQKDLENIRQTATTDRTQRQLDTQQSMQKAGFDQQNLFRAQSAALALRGLR